MDIDMKRSREILTWTSTMKGVPLWAWLMIVIADVGLLAWGAVAALAPGHLLGPDSTPILLAGYEGFTGGSWDNSQTPRLEPPTS